MISGWRTEVFIVLADAHAADLAKGVPCGLGPSPSAPQNLCQCCNDQVWKTRRSRSRMPSDLPLWPMGAAIATAAAWTRWQQGPSRILGPCKSSGLHQRVKRMFFFHFLSSMCRPIAMSSSAAAGLGFFGVRRFWAVRFAAENMQLLNCVGACLISGTVSIQWFQCRLLANKHTFFQQMNECKQI